ncbi:hypothetical protein [Luteibacter yeojuensis]|uniref:Transmembrane protein n=1 Tax=Luteibacter yeojuensis TaxID=345309 RepID=A0A0F3L0L6_9GAMM|nr:hypothetical protein [Luteibacter yeojuensis]KJV36747.1 hypothetical protein VI08_03015 [Luteibacter yeojuensis]
MPSDRSWMGYGIDGALQVGGIALLAGIVAYVVVRLIGKANGWSHGLELTLAALLAFFLAGGEDIWNSFYFNFVPIQSPQLLRVKLAAVHDPDSMGLRVLFEMMGALVGTGIGWAAFSGGLKDLIGHIRNP